MAPTPATRSSAGALGVHQSHRFVGHHQRIRGDNHLIVAEVRGVVVHLAGARLAVDDGLQDAVDTQGLRAVDLWGVDGFDRTAQARRR